MSALRDSKGHFISSKENPNGTIPNLYDILPMDLQEKSYSKLEELLDVPLVFLDADGGENDAKGHVRILLSKDPGGEQFYLKTSAFQPMKVLRWVMNNNRFPFRGMFTMDGNRLFLVNP